MISAIKVTPINSLLFVSDPNGGEAPEPKRGAMIVSTPSCISLGCYPEPDGPTEVILGNASQIDPGVGPAFDGELETPNRSVVVSTVTRETLLAAKVPSTRTRVRIWLSHPQWPEKVIIGLA